MSRQHLKQFATALMLLVVFSPLQLKALDASISEGNVTLANVSKASIQCTSGYLRVKPGASALSKVRCRDVRTIAVSAKPGTASSMYLTISSSFRFLTDVLFQGSTQKNRFSIRGVGSSLNPGVNIVIDGVSGDDVLDLDVPVKNQKISADPFRIAVLSGTSPKLSIGFSGIKSISVDGSSRDDAIDLRNLSPEVVLTVAGGAGDDLIQTGAGNDSISGGLGNDTILSGAGDDRISGDEGNDTIDGEEGDDLIYGGVGNDTLNGSGGADELRGQGGVDTISGDAGADLLRGGARSDKLFGGKGDDIIKGGQGRDVIWGGPGTDELRAGPQVDQCNEGENEFGCE